MKVKYLFSALCATLILSGCGDSELSEQAVEADNVSKSVELRGHSTLSQALICLDLNGNNVCNENELSTRSSEDGSYKLVIDHDVDEGTNIIATEGKNLILLEENSNNHTLLSPYHKGLETLNINTLTTLVSLAMREGQVYDDAVAYVASRYNLDEKLIPLHPLDTILVEETQKHFLTIQAMEKYQLQVSSKNQSVALRSGGWNLEIISFDEADESLTYFDILKNNVFVYMVLLVTYTNSVFVDILEYVGILEPTVYDDIQNIYNTVDEENLNETLKMFYEQNLTNIQSGDITSLAEELKNVEEDEKLYIDLISVFNNMDNNELKLFLASILTLVDDAKATKYFTLMLYISNGAENEFATALNKLTKSFVYNKTGDENLANSAPLLKYWKDENHTRYASEVAAAIFLIGDQEDIAYVLKDIQASFNTSFEKGASALESFRYAHNDATTAQVIEIYDSALSSDDFKLLLRTELGYIASDAAIQKLYKIASLVEDENDFDNVVQLFKTAKNFNDNAAFIVLERPSDGDIAFKVEALRTQIEAVFRD